MSSKREQILTPEGRLVFPHLFEPTAFEGSEKETYNCVLVFPKGTNIDALKAAVKAAFAEKFPKGAAGARSPFRDGNEKAGDWGEVFKDAIFIRASSQFLPKVVDRRKQELLDEDEVYSGCYARLVVAPFAYDTKGNKGVSFGLDLVQKLRDGERLGGSAASLGMLDDLPDDGDPFANAASGGMSTLSPDAAGSSEIF